MSEEKKCLRCKAKLFIDGFCGKCQREMYKDVRPVVYGEKPEPKA